MGNSLDEKLVDIEKALGGDGKLPEGFDNSPYKLDWHLNKIEQLIKDGGNSGGDSGGNVDIDTSDLGDVGVDSLTFKTDHTEEDNLILEATPVLYSEDYASGDYIISDKTGDTIESVFIDEGHKFVRQANYSIDTFIGTETLTDPNGGAAYAHLVDTSDILQLYNWGLDVVIPDNPGDQFNLKTEDANKLFTCISRGLPLGIDGLRFECLQGSSGFSNEYEHSWKYISISGSEGVVTQVISIGADGNYDDKTGDFINYDFYLIDKETLTDIYSICYETSMDLKENLETALNIPAFSESDVMTLADVERIVKLIKNSENFNLKLALNLSDENSNSIQEIYQPSLCNVDPDGYDYVLTWTRYDGDSGISYTIELAYTEGHEEGKDIIPTAATILMYASEGDTSSSSNNDIIIGGTIASSVYGNVNNVYEIADSPDNSEIIQALNKIVENQQIPNLVLDVSESMIVHHEDSPSTTVSIPKFEKFVPARFYKDTDLGKYVVEWNQVVTNKGFEEEYTPMIAPIQEDAGPGYNSNNNSLSAVGEYSLLNKSEYGIRIVFTPSSDDGEEYEPAEVTISYYDLKGMLDDPEQLYDYENHESYYIYIPVEELPQQWEVIEDPDTIFVPIAYMPNIRLTVDIPSSTIKLLVGVGSDDTDYWPIDGVVSFQLSNPFHDLRDESFPWIYDGKVTTSRATQDLDGHHMVVTEFNIKLQCVFDSNEGGFNIRPFMIKGEEIATIDYTPDEPQEQEE